jgi:hypothetical protein
MFWEIQFGSVHVTGNYGCRAGFHDFLETQKDSIQSPHILYTEPTFIHILTTRKLLSDI